MYDPKQFKGFTISLLAALVLLAVFYGHVFMMPSHYLLGPEAGDSLKNYYTPYYYVNHDPAGWWSEGMYYPYGEHIIFTDNQPIISASIKWVHEHIFPIGGHVPGIINMLVLLAQVLCAGLMYLILRKFGLPFWFAIALGVCIALLSPQIGRFSAHYALAYSFFLPFYWLLLIQSMERQRWVWHVAAGIFLLASAFCHVYYLGLGLAFVIPYLFFAGIHKRFSRAFLLKSLVPSTVSIAAAVVVFKLILQWTDPATDRPSDPWGYQVFSASLEGVFLPSFGIIFQILKKPFHLGATNIEGQAYVGLSAIVAIFLFFVWLIYRKGARWQAWQRLSLPAHLVYGMLAGVCALIFSFGIIHEWIYQIEFLAPFKQFRSPGRFAWLFYYPFAALGAYALYQLYGIIAQKKKVIAYVLIALLGSFWLFESMIMVREMSLRKTGPKADKWPTEKSRQFYGILEQNDLEVSNFQALIGFPRFVVGGELINLEREHHVSQYAMEWSALTGLPMVDGMLARVSYDRTRKVIQLTSHPWVPKEALPEFDDNRPLLLLSSGINIRPNEQLLMDKGEKLGELDWITIYRLPLSAFEQEPPNCDTPSAANPGHFVFNSFDEQPAPVSMTGQGAFTADGAATIYEGKFETGSDTIEASVWMHADSSQEAWPYFYAKLYMGQELIDEQSFFAKHPQNIWGNWIRLSVLVAATPGTDRIEIGTSHGPATFDNLLIRAISDTVIINENDRCLINNFPTWHP